jgi:hypothetical protein
MVTLSRRQARGLRGAFRRRALGFSARGPGPTLLFVAGEGRLRARFSYADLALENDLGHHAGPAEALALPAEALAELAACDDSPVTLEALTPEKTLARWVDRGLPRVREFAVPPAEAFPPFPPEPNGWSPAPAALLEALAEASLTAAGPTTRYALDCVLLRDAGGRHEAVATDGHRLVVLGGFTLPWSGDLLVRGSPVFARGALPRDSPPAVARTAEHVAVRAGAWTVHMKVQRAAHFPRVDRVIPPPGAAATRLALDPEDGVMLLAELARTTGADAAHGPVTLDLDGRVAVRARGEAGVVTELLLARSLHTGPAVRLCTDRALLARAVRGGFRSFELTGAGAPVVCRDGDRLYAWQPFDPGFAVPPAEDAACTDASRVGGRAYGLHRSTPEGNTAVNDRHEPTPPAPSADGDAADGAAGLASLIREAESLQSTLVDARNRAARLASALRRHRKRERLVAATLASLRQLRLQEAAG